MPGSLHGECSVLLMAIPSAQASHSKKVGYDEELTYWRLTAPWAQEEWGRGRLGLVCAL